MVFAERNRSYITRKTLFAFAKTHATATLRQLHIPPNVMGKFKKPRHGLRKPKGRPPRVTEKKKSGDQKPLQKRGETSKPNK
jgi:cation transport ATPase